MKQGFEKLQTVIKTKPTFACFGNHDVHCCDLMKLQRTLMEPPLHLIGQCFFRTLRCGNSSAHLLAIDTNVYEGVKPEKYNTCKVCPPPSYRMCSESGTCGEEMEDDCVDSKKTENPAEQQKTHALGVVTRLAQNDNYPLIVMGHVPPVSYRPMKPDKQWRYQDLMGLLVSLFNKCKEQQRKFVYICADTHNYQRLKVVVHEKETKLQKVQRELRVVTEEMGKINDKTRTTEYVNPNTPKTDMENFFHIHIIGTGGTTLDDCLAPLDHDHITPIGPDKGTTIVLEKFSPHHGVGVLDLTQEVDSPSFCDFRIASECDTTNYEAEIKKRTEAVADAKEAERGAKKAEEGHGGRKSKRCRAVPNKRLSRRLRFCRRSRRWYGKTRTRKGR